MGRGGRAARGATSHSRRHPCPRYNRAVPSCRAAADEPAGTEAGRGFFLRCGTYGCTLPNNHRGLHKLPDDDSSRKRRRPQLLEPSSDGKKRAAGAGPCGKGDGGEMEDGDEESAMVVVEEEEGPICDEVPAEEDGVEDEEYEEGDALEETVSPDSQLRREGSGRKRVPSAKIRGQQVRLPECVAGVGALVGVTRLARGYGGDRSCRAEGRTLESDSRDSRGHGRGRGALLRA